MKKNVLGSRLPEIGKVQMKRVRKIDCRSGPFGPSTSWTPVRASQILGATTPLASNQLASQLRRAREIRRSADLNRKLSLSATACHQCAHPAAFSPGTPVSPAVVLCTATQMRSTSHSPRRRNAHEPSRIRNTINSINLTIPSISECQ